MTCFSRCVVNPLIELVGKLFGIACKVFGNAAYLCRKLFFGALHLCIQIIDPLLHQFKRLVALHTKIFVVRGIFWTDTFDRPFRRCGKTGNFFVYSSTHLGQLLIDASLPCFKIGFSCVKLSAWFLLNGIEPRFYLFCNVFYFNALLPHRFLQFKFETGKLIPHICLSFFLCLIHHIFKLCVIGKKRFVACGNTFGNSLFDRRNIFFEFSKVPLVFLRRLRKPCF